VATAWAAVVGSRRKQAAFIEVDIQTKAAFAWGEFRSELRFVIFVDRSVERAEVFLHLVIESVQLLLKDGTVGVVGRLCGRFGDIRGLVVPHSFTIIAETDLCGRQERLSIARCALIRLGIQGRGESRQAFRKRLRHFQPTGFETILKARNPIHCRELRFQCLGVGDQPNGKPGLGVDYFVSD
jgi:hypothetical protein